MPEFYKTSDVQPAMPEPRTQPTIGSDKSDVTSKHASRPVGTTDSGRKQEFERSTGIAIVELERAMDRLIGIGRDDVAAAYQKMVASLDAYSNEICPPEKKKSLGLKR